MVSFDIPTFASGAAGLVPASGGGTTNFLRADGSFAAPPSGSGMTYPGAGISVSTGSAWSTSITAGTGVATALSQNTNSTTGILVNGSSANLGAGYTTTIYTMSAASNGGTSTPSMPNGNIQSLSNPCTAAWTLAPPSISSGQAAHLHLVVTNSASGTLVAPTVSGFSQSDITAYATTNSKVFDFYIYAENAFSTLKVVARP